MTPPPPPPPHSNSSHFCILPSTWDWFRDAATQLGTILHTTKRPTIITTQDVVTTTSNKEVKIDAKRHVHQHTNQDTNQDRKWWRIISKCIQKSPFLWHDLNLRATYNKLGLMRTVQQQCQSKGVVPSVPYFLPIQRFGIAASVINICYSKSKNSPRWWCQRRLRVQSLRSWRPVVR